MYNRNTLSISSLLAIGVMANSAVAATPFSDSLKGYDGNNTSASDTFITSDLGASDFGSNQQISFTTAGAVTGAGTTDNAWQGRNYLRTDDADYGLADFTAFVTVDREVAADNDGLPSLVFFGLGEGAPRSFRTPDGADGGQLSNASTHLKLQAQTFISWHADVEGGSDGIQEVGFAGGQTVSGVTRLMMTYDSVAETINYDIDYDYTGVFSSDATSGAFSIGAVATDFKAGGIESSIYFGGGSGSTFSDFQVVIPEPSSFALLAGMLALGGVAVRRKRA